MRNDTIAKELRRGNINMLVTGIVIALASSSILILTARTNLNELLGPVAMTPAQLIRIQDPSKLLRYYISTNGSKVSGTVFKEGYENTDRDDPSKKTFIVTGEIQMLQLDEKVVLIRRKQSSKDTSIAGALIKMPSELEEVKARLCKDPNLKSQLLPLLIDATRFNWGGYFVLIVFTAILICGLTCIYTAMIRLVNMFNNPNIKSLNRFGDAKAVLPEVEEELRQPSGVFRCSMLWLTKNWLITSKLTGLEIRSVKELVWIYPQITNHANYDFSASKSPGVVICDNSGKYTQIYLPSDNFDAIIENLRKRAPWAFFGHTAELEARWRKKTRAAMIAAVEERRLTIEHERTDQNSNS